MDSSPPVTRSKAVKDPISESLAFCVMSESPDFPPEMRQGVAGMQSRGKEIMSRSGGPAEWLDYYTMLRQLAVDTVVALNKSVASTLTPGDMSAGAGQAVSRHLSSVQKLLPEVTRIDHDAFSYVASVRVPKQRDTYIWPFLEERIADIVTDHQLDDSVLTVQIEESSCQKLVGAVSQAFSQWRTQALDGLFDRIRSQREQIVACVQDDLVAIQEQIPQPPAVEMEPLSMPRISPSVSARLPSWPELAWRFFRSGFGMVSMLAGVLGSVILMLSTSGGASGGNLGQRALIVLWALPALAVVAILYAVRARGIEKRKLLRHLDGELRKQLETRLRQATDSTMNQIQATIRKAQSNTDYAMKTWSLSLEKRVVKAAPLASPTPVPDGKSVARVQAMLSKLTGKILPAIDIRISFLENVGSDS